MREQLGDRLPQFTKEEFQLLGEAPVDFYGMNYYTCQYAKHLTTPAPDTDCKGNVEETQENKAGVAMGAQAGIFWLQSVPAGFRKHLTRIYKKYGKTIYITENGCPCPGEDKMTKEQSTLLLRPLGRYRRCNSGWSQGGRILRMVVDGQLG
jgi:beta-glucosidase